jgi:hypothetical protein
VPGIETRLGTRDGAILLDPALAEGAGDHWFDPACWPSSATSSVVAGGRGGVVFLRDGVR